MSQIVIVSGPPGAGKSSAVEALCERYDRTVHIETDQFYGSIRMGFVKPWLPSSDDQNRMVSRAAARAATAYAEQRYAVFIDGVIGPHLLPLYLGELTRAQVPVQFVMLMPSREETERRGLARDARVPQEQVLRIHRQFREWGPFAGCTIDNSAGDAQQTADLIMDACGRGECQVYSPD